MHDLDQRVEGPRCGAQPREQIVEGVVAASVQVDHPQHVRLGRDALRSRRRVDPQSQRLVTGDQGCHDLA
ncbi:hypothetical protein QE454_002925 [Microbacterium sp. SORGH_AS454]|nr:hypothetical protein [Microbacterium sp. SORGH_AS_0454]